jgi:hypothetical protein
MISAVIFLFLLIGILAWAFGSANSKIYELETRVLLLENRLASYEMIQEDIAALVRGAYGEKPDWYRKNGL